MAFYFAYGDRMNAEKMAGSIPVLAWSDPAAWTVIGSRST